MKTILIVEDDKQMREMFVAALIEKGYRVLQADSGSSGIALARQHLPDLILTDIHMPGGDGSTLLRDIRKDPELRSRQVVLMTGRPDLITPRKGMEEGADDFLSKPVSLEALTNCLVARFSRSAVSWRVEDQMLAGLQASMPPNLPHEFFTPLAGIIGLTEILRSDSAAGFSADVIDIHNDIFNSAMRLNRTLRNYLLILDLQTPPAEIMAVPLLAPLAVAQSIKSGLEEALRQNGRRPDLRLDVQACSIAIGFENLCRIVEELMDNACKFSRHGTPLGLEMHADGRMVVSDEGKGMTPEEIGRIGVFKQFDRNKYEQQGLGLGLVLVQKLTTSANARFNIVSEPGIGTKIEITFSTSNGVGQLAERSVA